VNPVVYFLLMLKASLFSFSGSGNLPILRADLLARGWATDQQFVEALAVGQVSPGPSGLWVISFGFLMDGLRGSLLALVAVCLPPLAVIPLARLYARYRHLAAVQGFVRGIGLAVVGVLVVILLGMLRSAGLDARSCLIALGAFALAATRRLPVTAIIAVAALIGLALG